MSGNLLVGIDGSDCCDRAIALAAGRAKACGGHLIVAYVIEWSPYSFNTPEENQQRHRRREQEINTAHKRVLNPVVSRLRAGGIDAQGAVRHGHIAEVMKNLVTEFKVNEVFVGRTGHSRLKTMMYGSVAGTLVQISPVPVTVVP